ncbi:TfoX/Sxy family protein [bacterium]|nr:TfoX/Sxy family protein [bacterium]
MFGGLAFMISGNMCCGIVGDRLMARVGPEAYEACILKEHAVSMDFTGKPMQGMVFVEPEGFSEDADLNVWIETCMDFIRTLPPKKNETAQLRRQWLVN